MLETILQTLRLRASNDDQDFRREYERREMDSCIGVIDDVAFPIQNWSKGGIMLMGDDRQFGVNDIKTVTLKFKLADRVVEVAHSGRILRKGRDKFVLQFAPLTQNIERQFNHIVDDYVAQQFVNSQI